LILKRNFPNCGTNRLQKHQWVRFDPTARSAKACRRAAAFTVSPRTVAAASVPRCTLPTTAAPHPQLGPESVFDLKFITGDPNPPQDGEGRATRAQGCVFKRDQRAEDRHEAVATKAPDNAALLAYGFVHQLRRAPHERIYRFLSRPFGESRETHHVGEKDCDLPTFRFHAPSARATQSCIQRSSCLMMLLFRDAILPFESGSVKKEWCPLAFAAARSA
jgi:hypothetical protein